MVSLSASDIKFYYTGEATGPSDAHLSLGESISPNTIPDVVNNIFDDITGDESSSGVTHYRAIAIKDTSTEADMINPRIWIDGYVRSGDVPDTIYIAATTFSLNSNTMGVTSSETVAPDEDAGLIWVVEGSPSNTIGYDSNSVPTTVPNSFSDATLDAGGWIGLWIKRVVPSGASAFSGRAFTIGIRCETTASPIAHTITMYYTFRYYRGVPILEDIKKIVQ